MRAAAFLLVSISFSVAAARHNEPHRLRQATRHSVIGRAFANKYVNLDARNPSPSPSDNPTNPTCWCDDAHTIQCPIDDCFDSCTIFNDATFTAERRDTLHTEIPTPTQKRVWPSHQVWIPLFDYEGIPLPPIHAAQYFRTEGHAFDHPTNGSVRLRDERFIAFSQKLRKKASYAFSVHHLIKRGSDLGGSIVKFSGSWLVKYFSNQLARGEANGIQPEDLVLRLSDDYGIKASDVIPMSRVLLADPDMKEIVVHYHVFSREMLQYMVDVMCPALGPKMCGVGLVHDNGEDDGQMMLEA
ncbi:hypothetical protein BKA62DRAFT_203523 [Auriculariales sp. MPI-PUGE-AT-0066]|nr:hypothetical protein BKA62DRAFT_203523 [Auriculariales sp. MPI-PUGE-AT-0066]